MGGIGRAEFEQHHLPPLGQPPRQRQCQGTHRRLSLHSAVCVHCRKWGLGAVIARALCNFAATNACNHALVAAMIATSSCDGYSHDCNKRSSFACTAAGQTLRIKVGSSNRSLAVLSVASSFSLAVPQSLRVFNLALQSPWPARAGWQAPLKFFTHRLRLELNLCTKGFTYRARFATTRPTRPI